MQLSFCLELSTLVIEWLKFKVVAELREQFVQQDNEIWTAALATYPGFLGKEVWISPDDLTQIVTVVRWESAEQWHSIPPAELAQVEARFAAAMGDTYELMESAAFQQRKFME